MTKDILIEKILNIVNIANSNNMKDEEKCYFKLNIVDWINNKEKKKILSFLETLGIHIIAQYKKNEYRVWAYLWDLKHLLISKNNE